MTTSQSGRGRRTGGAFDVRTVIAALLAIYGVILLAMGLFGTSDAEIERADGVNANLWTGIGLLVGAAAFYAWTKWRPVVVPGGSRPVPGSDAGSDAGSDSGSGTGSDSGSGTGSDSGSGTGPDPRPGGGRA